MKHFQKLSIATLLLLAAGLACGLPSMVPTPVPPPPPTPTWTLLPDGLQAPTETAAPGETPQDTPTDPQATETGEQPPPSATTAPENGSVDCPTAPPSRVKVGDHARVTFTDGIPLRVRDKPEVATDNVIVQIAEGTEFDIIGGPQCAPIPGSNSSYVFWQIKIDASSTSGWVAEGDSAAYYIEPYE